MLTLAKLPQPENVESLMIVTEPLMAMLVRLPQFKKADAAIVPTETGAVKVGPAFFAGTVINVVCALSNKAPREASVYFAFEGDTVMLARLLHPLKAVVAMLVTLAGILMLVSPVF
jgi:hypothetical protein